MTPRMMRFFQGFGSVLDIMPSPNFEKLVPRRTPQEDMCLAWKDVGISFRTTFSHFVDEHSTNKSSSNK